MQRIFLTLGLACFFSCSTVEFVRKDFSPKKQAIVRYPPTSNDTKYRENLNQRATEFCGGPYQITKEYQAREETGNSVGVGTGVGIGMGGVMIGGSNRATSMYNFVEFDCK